MKCEDYRAQLVEYLDDELARPEREKLAAHLQACPDCRELAKRLEQSLAVFKAVAGEPPVEKPAGEVIELPQLSWWRRHRLSWLAAAAAIVLLVGAGLYLRPHSIGPVTAASQPSGQVLSQNVADEGPQQTFVYHGQGISRQNRLDLKL